MHVSAKFGLGKIFLRKSNTWAKCDQKPNNQGSFHELLCEKIEISSK